MSLQIVDGTLHIQDGYTLIEPTHQGVLFGFGGLSGQQTAISTTNRFEYPGIMSNDITGVGTPRSIPAAAGYGGDKAIFGFGQVSSGISLTNLVSNTGVMAADTAGVAVGTYRLGAATYGGTKAIFGFGYSDLYSITNHTYLVSDVGVMASSYSSAGTARFSLAAAGYGGDKALFVSGDTSLNSPAVGSTIYNLVSNAGVVATDSSGGYAMSLSGVAASYGAGNAIFAWGYTTDNFGTTYTDSQTYAQFLNTGVWGSNGTTVGSGRNFAGGSSYDGNKGVFGFGGGNNGRGVFYQTNTYNIISNTGVIASDSTALNASVRTGVGAAPYGG